MNLIDYYVGLSSHVKSSIIVISILSVILIIIGQKAKRADFKKSSTGILFLGEIIVKGLNDFSKSIYKSKYKLYAPYLITLTLFISFSILISLFGIVNPLSSMFVSLALSTITFLFIHISSIFTKGILDYLKSFLAPNPIFLPLNIIGELSFPISLGMRLFGNMLSGVLILTLVYGFTELAVSGLGYLGYVGLVVAPLFHIIFDIFFGGIQVLVFVMLSAIFISNAIEEDETN